MNVVYWLLLTAAIVPLWLMPLSSSFWVDELVTAFVVRHGADHPSFSVAPQVPLSLYYWLPRGMQSLFGLSEISYRLPSTILMGITLFLVARLAARLIHPQAGWFAVFACLTLRGFNYQAADARPYALGTVVLAASVLFLLRWMDSARWLDAAGFLVLASLLLRVHLIFWPCYLALALYAAVRLAKSETSVRWLAAIGVFSLLAISLAPPAIQALQLMREAEAHVIAELPDLGDLRQSLKLGLVEACLIGAWLLREVARRQSDADSTEGGWPSISSISLIVGWWLFQPLGLYAFSYVTGNSVFVPRYLAIALPGAALAATVVVQRFLPANRWKVATVLVGFGAVIAGATWRTALPRHDRSDWRSAVQLLERTVMAPQTPVLCPSPFVEAQAPYWSPDYSLPGFLYAHLDIYRIPGKAYLLPFETSPEAEEYVRRLSQGTLTSAGRFLIYGGDRNVKFWRNLLAAHPEFAGWRTRQLGIFGDVEVVEFARIVGVTGLAVN